MLILKFRIVIFPVDTLRKINILLKEPASTKNPERTCLCQNYFVAPKITFIVDINGTVATFTTRWSRDFFLFLALYSLRHGQRKKKFNFSCTTTLSTLQLWKYTFFFFISTRLSYPDIFLYNLTSTTKLTMSLTCQKSFQTISSPQNNV